ncbi:hypothetical protein PG987_004976 [Apiospora arundinis]
MLTMKPDDDPTPVPAQNIGKSSFCFGAALLVDGQDGPNASRLANQARAWSDLYLPFISAWAASLKGKDLRTSSRVYGREIAPDMHSYLRRKGGEPVECRRHDRRLLLRSPLDRSRKGQSHGSERRLGFWRTMGKPTMLTRDAREEGGVLTMWPVPPERDRRWDVSTGTPPCHHLMRWDALGCAQFWEKVACFVGKQLQPGARQGA